MRRLIAAIACGLALAACSPGGTIVTPPAPKTARQVAFEAEFGYRALQALAIRYNALPRCTAADVAVGGVKVTCSDAGVVKAMRQVDADAVTALANLTAVAAAWRPGDEAAVANALAAVSAATQTLRSILTSHGITEASLA